MNPTPTAKDSTICNPMPEGGNSRLKFYPPEDITAYQEHWDQIIFFDPSNLNNSIWGCLKYLVNIKASGNHFEQLRASLAAWKTWAFKPGFGDKYQWCLANDLISLAQQTVEPSFQIEKNEKPTYFELLDFNQKQEFVFWLRHNSFIQAIKGTRKSTLVLAEINGRGSVASFEVEVVRNGHGHCYADPFANGLLQFNEEFKITAQRILALSQKKAAMGRHKSSELEKIDLRYRLNWLPPASKKLYKIAETRSIECAMYIGILSTLESYLLRHHSFSTAVWAFFKDDAPLVTNDNIAITAALDDTENSVCLSGVGQLHAKVSAACKEGLRGIIIADEDKEKADKILKNLKIHYFKCNTTILPAKTIEDVIDHISCATAANPTTSKWFLQSLKFVLCFSGTAVSIGIIGYIIDSIEVVNSAAVASLFSFFLILAWTLIHQLNKYGLINSTFIATYAAGLLSSLAAALLYAFGPIAVNDRIHYLNQIMKVKPIWHIKLIRFMIPGSTVPIFFGILFAARSSNNRKCREKPTRLSVLAWLILTLGLGVVIRASVDLFKYRLKFSSLWYIFEEEKVGNVRFETFLLVAFLSILSLIIFENWKKMPMHEKKAYNYTRFLFPSIFVILTGSALAYFHWGEGLSIPAGNTFYHALKNVGLITGWGMGCYYLFTGNHFLIKLIDRLAPGKRHSKKVDRGRSIT